MKKRNLTALVFLVFGLLCRVSSAQADVGGNMRVHVLRLTQGDDPKAKLEAFVAEKKIKAAVVVSAVGSLTQANIRFANQDRPELLKGHFEIVSLSGTLSSTGGTHLHVSISDEKGKTTGGHLVDGSKIYTTLEVAVGELTDVEFTRELDPVTTYKELKVMSSK